jgi:probable rRNA maturation factor
MARTICRAALKAGAQWGGNVHHTVAVRLIDDEEMRALNQAFRGQDKSTNVLSFPDGVEEAEEGTMHIGDVAISMDRVVREALAQGKPVEHHLAHLMAHGALHLVGFDHENEEDADKMEGLEIDILGKFGIPNPYL